MLDEKLYWTQKPKGALGKIASFLLDTDEDDNDDYNDEDDVDIVSHIVSNWLDDQEMLYDISLNSKFRVDVKNYAKQKYSKMSSRAKRNPRVVSRLLTKALELKYEKDLESMAQN